MRGTSGELRFFTLGDARYFLGIVALVNSLRLHGHVEPLYVLDLGLTDSQRDLLKAECEILDLPPEQDAPPMLLKPYPRVLGHQGPMIFIDSDVIVTAPLTPLADAARAGRIAAFPDFLHERWSDTWRTLFALEQAPRRNPYLNAGVVAFSGEHFPDLLPRWWDACQRLVGRELSVAQRDASVYADQDALNAILMAEFPAERIQLLLNDQCPMGPDALAATTIVDVDSVRCRYGSTPTLALHATKSPKPWNHESLLRRPWNAYHTLLQRLVCRPGTAIEVPPSQVPTFLRPTPAGSAIRNALRAAGPSYVRGRAVARRARAVARKAEAAYLSATAESAESAVP